MAKDRLFQVIFMAQGQKQTWTYIGRNKTTAKRYILDHSESPVKILEIWERVFETVEAY